MASDVERRPRKAGEPSATDSGLVGGMIADAVRPAVAETLDKARVAGEQIVERAGGEARRTAGDVERRASRVATHVGRETREVVADLDERLGRQQEALEETVRGAVEDWHEGHRRLADEVMDRVIAVGITVLLLYAAYYYYSATHPGPVNFLSIGMLFWMGLTLCTGIVWVAWQLSGRSHRLKPILTWFLYILALAGVSLVVIGVMKEIAGMF